MKVEKLDHGGSGCQLLSSVNLVGGGWTKSDNKKRSERDEQRQVLECLLCNVNESGHNSRNPGRQEGFVAEAVCSVLRFRNISSVGKWSAKLRFTAQCRKSVRC